LRWFCTSAVNKSLKFLPAGLLGSKRSFGSTDKFSSVAKFCNNFISGTISPTLYSCPAPVITAFKTHGNTFISSSMVSGWIYLPLASLYSSLNRPVMNKKPSSSRRPRSPVRTPLIPFISTMTSLVFSGLLWYPIIHCGPKQMISPSSPDSPVRDRSITTSVLLIGFPTDPRRLPIKGELMVMAGDVSLRP